MADPFLESPRFPEDLSVGVTFGPEFETVIAKPQGAKESRNIVRDRALCVGECAHAVRTQTQLDALLQFFRAVHGRGIPFRFKDWSDYRLLATDSLLLPVDGAPNQFQLGKSYYMAAGIEEQRVLQKIVAGTFALSDGGSPVPPGAGAGQYAVDVTTGIITIGVSQTRTINTHTVGAAHQVVLASALSPNVVAGDFVSLSGVTGSAAATLNGERFEVTVQAGATLTLDVDTTGLTAAGGTLSLFRQGATLQASCEFDVPVRFDTDRMTNSVIAYGLHSWNQIPIMEVRV